MKDAINLWYVCHRSNNDSIEFRDTCFSVHCHDSCPEDIDFIQETNNDYPIWANALIITIVVTITVLSLVVKVYTRTYNHTQIMCMFFLV